MDSYEIGELPDADKFGDKGSNTLRSIGKSKEYDTPNLEKLGLFNIDGVTSGKKEASSETVLLKNSKKTLR